MTFLKRLFAPRPSIEHPVLGKIRLLPGKKGFFWMHDTYSDDEIAISVDTINGEPPTDEQVAFYQMITNDPDAAFARVASRVIPEYEKWLKQPFPKDWREAFKLSGIGVPLAGNENNEWDLTFVLLTNNRGFLFNCYFENGRLVHVGVDT